MKYILFFFISLGISETNWTYTRVEANDPISNTLFGYSVAMNGMGNKVITSAIGYNYNAGKVYKFIEIENQWIQEYILEPNFGANQGDWFGYSLDISYDGEIVIIGSPFDDTVLYNAGSVTIFNNDQQVIQLFPTLLHFHANFGRTVKISNNGTLCFIGAPDTTNNNFKGSVYIYSFNGITWNQQTIIQALDGVPNQLFGYKIDITQNASYLAISAPGDHESGIEFTGAVYIFKYISYSVWNQEVKLISPSLGNLFGFSISLSGNGQYIAISAIKYNNNSGIVYSFKKQNQIWSQDSQLIPDQNIYYDYFGHSLDISFDGSIILVGAPSVPPSTQYGKAYKFSNYIKTDLFTVNVSCFSENSISFSFISNPIIIGSYTENSETGSFYIFSSIINSSTSSSITSSSNIISSTSSYVSSYTSPYIISSPTSSYIISSSSTNLYNSTASDFLIVKIISIVIFIIIIIMIYFILIIICIMLNIHCYKILNLSSTLSSTRDIETSVTQSLDEYLPNLENNESSNLPKIEDNGPYNNLPNLENNELHNIPKIQNGGPYNNLPKIEDSGPYNNLPKIEDSGPYNNLPSIEDSGPYNNLPSIEDSGPYNNISKIE